MKNSENWLPTKFIQTPQGWKPNNDPKMVAPGSRIITNAMISHYENAIKNYVKGSLLDLGCGHVPFYGIYKNCVTNITCIDWENSMHKNQFLDFTVDLNQALPIQNEVFDSIICTDVLEHIFNPALLVSEMARIMKKGGNLILGVPFYYWLHEAPHDYYRYTEFALKNLLESNGFKILKLEPYGGSPEIFGDLIAKHLSKVPLLLKIHNSLWIRLLKLSFLLKASRKSAKKFPLGYCVVAQKNN
jgi:SAM-dependent methyltransferase